MESDINEDIQKFEENDNTIFVVLLGCLFITCCGREEDKQKLPRVLKYLLSNKIINKDNFQKTPSTGYGNLGKEDFFYKFKEIHPRLQEELCRIMRQYIPVCDLSDLKHCLIKEENIAPFSDWVNKLSEKGNGKFQEFLDKASVIFSINSIVLQSFSVDLSWNNIEDYSFITKLVEKPTKELESLRDKLDYYTVIIDKNKLNEHKEEIESILEQTRQQPQFSSFIDNYWTKSKTNNNDDLIETVEYQDITDKTLTKLELRNENKLEDVKELSHWLVENEYFDKEISIVFTEGVKEGEKIKWLPKAGIGFMLIFIRLYKDCDPFNKIEGLKEKCEKIFDGKRKFSRLGGTDNNKINNEGTKEYKLKVKLDKLFPQE